MNEADDLWKMKIEMYKWNHYNSHKKDTTKLPEACPVGQYRSTQDQECVECAENTVSVEVGAVQCTPCPPGRVSNSNNTLCGRDYFIVFTFAFLPAVFWNDNPEWNDDNPEW